MRGQEVDYHEERYAHHHTDYEITLQQNQWMADSDLAETVGILKHHIDQTPSHTNHTGYLNDGANKCGGGGNVVKIREHCNNSRKMDLSQHHSF